MSRHSSLILVPEQNHSEEKNIDPDQPAPSGTV